MWVPGPAPPIPGPSASPCPPGHHPDFQGVCVADPAPPASPCPPGHHPDFQGVCVASTAHHALAEEVHPAGHTAGDCWANHPDAESTCEGHHYDQKKCESIKWRSTGKPKCHWGPEMTHDMHRGHHASGCPAGEVQHADGSCHCPEGMHWFNDPNDGVCVPNASHCPPGEVQHADGSCHCPEGMHWSNDTNDGACVATTAHAALAEVHPA